MAIDSREINSVPNIGVQKKAVWGMDRNKLFKNISRIAAIIALAVLAVVGYLFFTTLVAGALTLNSIVAYGIPAAVACTTIVTSYMNYLKFDDKEKALAQKSVALI